MDKTFFTRNRKTLFENIPDGALFVICSGGNSHRSADEDFRFFANRNFVYLTGIDEPDCILFARRAFGKLHETLYIRDPDPEVEKWTGRRITVEEAKEASGIEDIAMRSDFDNSFHKAANDTYYNGIYLCLEANAGQEQTDKNHAFYRMIREKYVNFYVGNLFNQIASLRMIKSSEEVTAIKKAVDITREGILRMMSVSKDAKTEMDLFAEFMYVIHKHGAVEPAFKPIISCGENNFFLHYDTPSGKLFDDKLCLVDVGAKVDFCNVDISRVFPRSGTFNERQKLIYNIALDINEIVTNAIKPGMFFKDINDMNRELTFPRLKAAGLLTDIADINKYIWHRCSHHIGFDVHDVGSYEEPLAEGMFFSMDMGLYIREWGIGMRIEDDVLVTADGLTNISRSIPRTIDEIENAMQQ